MAELLIKTLKCIRNDDPGLDKDETVVRINSSTVSGPHKLGKGDSVTLNYRRNFTGSVVVSLVEQDAGRRTPSGRSAQGERVPRRAARSLTAATPLP